MVRERSERNGPRAKRAWCIVSESNGAQSEPRADLGEAATAANALKNAVE